MNSMVKKRKSNSERYRYRYSRIKYKTKTILSHAKLIVGLSLLISILMTTIIVRFYETPKDRQLKRENQKLLTQYELMYKSLEDMEKVLGDLQQRDDYLYRVVFEADPIPSSVRKAGFGGINKYKQLENFDNSELIIKTARKLDVIAKEAYIQSRSYDEILNLAMDKEKMLASIPAIMPVSNKDLTRTASGWGNRIHPIYKIRHFHTGMDFTAPVGTDVYATGDGVVKKVVTEKSGYGRHIVIDHGFGYQSLYAHLSEFNVKPGQKIKRGSIIGYVGNTGTSTGPHLHYEVRKNEKPVNPQYYYFNDLSAEEYERMIALSNNAGQSYD